MLVCPKKRSSNPRSSHPLRGHLPIERVAVVLSLLSALVGCSDKPKHTLKNPKDCKPVPVEIFLQAHTYLNQNKKGQSMPVEVRVMLLKRRDAFDKLDFETAWQHGEEAVADDLVRSASITVFPGKLKIYPMKSAPEARYVALVGIFRKPKGRDWAHVVDITEQNKRCESGESLHTIVHALVRDYKITEPEPDAEAVQ